VGGREDVRDRPAEFAARGSVSREVLLEKMKEAVREADETLVKLDTERLSEKRKIQGYDVTCFGGIFHVVEHFSGHVGQII
jgi:hypothetical protein